MSRGRTDTALASIGLTGGMTGRSMPLWLHAGPAAAAKPGGSSPTGQDRGSGPCSGPGRLGLVSALGELLDDLGAEGRQVGRLAVGLGPDLLHAGGGHEYDLLALQGACHLVPPSVVRRHVIGPWPTAAKDRKRPNPAR